MALFNNRYSGLITKGLGLPASHGLITMNFGVFYVKIDIVEPPQFPQTGGGGGAVSIRGITVPFRTKQGSKTKLVQITVKMSNDKVWRKSYLVDAKRTDITVKVINLITSLASKVNIGIEHIKHAARSVVAVFKHDK